jgi:hypothetical protein
MECQGAGVACQEPIGHEAQGVPLFGDDHPQRSFRGIERARLPRIFVDLVPLSSSPPRTHFSMVPWT